MDFLNQSGKTVVVRNEWKSNLIWLIQEAGAVNSKH